MKLVRGPCDFMNTMRIVLETIDFHMTLSKSSQMLKALGFGGRSRDGGSLPNSSMLTLHFIILPTLLAHFIATHGLT